MRGIFLVCAVLLLLSADGQTIRCFGDSFTEGIGANSSEAYPVILSQLLTTPVRNLGAGYDRSIETKNKLLADSANKGQSTIIWTGRNNYHDSAQVIADIAACVASLGHERYLILPIWQSEEPNEDKGKSDYNIIIALNNRLSDIYGERYVPIRELLVKQYDPAFPLDSLSFVNDRVPYSMRSGGGFHPNKVGYYEIAKIISTYSVELGLPALQGRWLGIQSGDVNDAANWMGGIPNFYSDVVIHPGTPHDPIIKNELNCANLFVGRGVQLAITGTLKIAGKIVNAELIDARAGIVELNGNLRQMLPPYTFVENAIGRIVNNFRGQIPARHAMAYLSPITFGNFSYEGELGMEFQVNDPNGIVITHLGVFDHQGNGINGSQNGGIRVGIFDVATKQIVPGLDTIIKGDSDSYIAGHRMRRVNKVTLPPGNYLIMAKGFAASEMAGNNYLDGNRDYGDDVGNNQITLVRTWYGNNLPNGFNYPSIYDDERKHQFLAGSFIFETNAVRGGFAVAGPTDVLSEFVPLAGTVETHGFLTLKSTATATARITQGDSLGRYIDGPVMLERFIPKGKRAYRHLASGVNSILPIINNWQEGKPVTATPGMGMHITGSTTGANGFDKTNGGGISMFTYSAGAPSFTSIGNTDIKKLDALQAYRVFINGDRFADLTIPTTTNGTGSPNIEMNRATTIRVYGNIITGPVTFNSGGATTISGTDVTKNLSPVVHDFNMVVNPYWSPVDFDTLEKNDVGKTYWLWDPALGNRGGYVTYNSITGGTPGSDVTKDIQPGQSIFIETTGPNPSIRFDEKSKSSGFTNTFRTTGDNNPRLSVKLYTNAALATNKGVQDAAGLVFNDAFDRGIGNEDGVKFTNTDENIAIYNNGTFLSMEGRPNIRNADTVAIRIWRLYNSNYYTLKLEGSNFEQTLFAAIYDKYLNTSYPISLNGSTEVPFVFSTDSASYFNRFFVVFRSAVTLANNAIVLSGTKSGATAKLQWKVQDATQATAYELQRASDDGIYHSIDKFVASAADNYTGFDYLPTVGNNYYRVKQTMKSGNALFSNGVKLNFNAIDELSIYPSPLKGGSFHLNTSVQDPGKYLLTIIDQNGREVFQRFVQLVRGANNTGVTIGSAVPAGTYRVILALDKCIIGTKSLLIIR